MAQIMESYVWPVNRFSGALKRFSEPVLSDREGRRYTVVNFFDNRHSSWLA